MRRRCNAKAHGRKGDFSGTKKSLRDFSAEFVKRVVHFLWRQWGQIGLASASVEPRDGWIVDPEALLLLSATFARHDPRLFDEIMQLEGRMKHYFVRKKDRPHFLCPPDEPALMPFWVTWPPVFRALDLMLCEVRRMETQPLSDLLLASELRRLAERMRPLMRQTGPADGISDPTRHPGVAYTPAFFEQTEKWLVEVLGEQRQDRGKWR